MSQPRQSLRPPLRRGFLAGAVVFLTLIGTGTATALWSTQTNVEPFTADAATVGVSHTVGTGLTHTYTATDLTAAQAVVVTNTGNREAAFSVTVSATSASDLRTHVTARLDVVANQAACTASAALSSPTTGVVSAPVTFTSAPGALAAGASVTVCVQTAMSTVAGHASKTLSGTVVSSTSASTQAGWNAATTAATFTQTVTSVVPPATVTSNAWYWIRNAQQSSLCAETKWWQEIEVWQANNCGVDSTWSASKNELWRFADAGSGSYYIINMYHEEEFNEARRWTVENGSGKGAPIQMGTSPSAQQKWVLIDHGDGTVSFRLSGPNRCATIDGAALGNEIQLVTQNCNANNPNQRFVLDMLEIVVPPPAAFTCTGDQWTMYNSWPPLTGYEHLVTYRVFLDGVLLPSDAYTRAKGDDPTLQFGHSDPELHAFLTINGYGTKQLTVEQTVMGGPWTLTGYGNVTLSASTPVLQCGP